MVLAAMVGVSFAMIPTLTLGLFMAPLQAEFGWTRTEISAGLTVFSLVNLPLVPLAGILVDRYGSRRLALPGLVLSSFAFSAFGLLNGSLVQWFGTWLLFTVVALAINIMVWTTAVSSAFTKSRGMAIALVLSGSALSQAIAPTASRWLIDEIGWRGAYFALGGLWGGIAFVLGFFLFHDGARAQAARGSDVTIQAISVPGLTLGEALRRLTLYRIGLAMFLQTMFTSAAIVHMIPMLTSMGLDRAGAASLTLVFAAATLAGKLVTGWLVDRVSAAWLPAISYGGPALSCILMMQGPGSVEILAVAIAILGYSAGAAMQLTAYLATRYVGLRSFGTVYGVFSTLMALAGGTGPLIAGMIFDRTDTYALMLTSGFVATAIAGLATLRLGPYPDFSSQESLRSEGVAARPLLGCDTVDAGT